MRINAILLSFYLLLLGYIPHTAQAQEMIWEAPVGTTWQWQLTDDINTSYDVAMYDVDLFDTPQTIIDQLHADERIVICYFSAGTYEDWRDDAPLFPDELIGRRLDEWEGERYLDIREIAMLAPIMQARLDLARDKGCDGVEPDNVENYTNRTGFRIRADHQLAYNLWLAEESHARGLSIGLKNDSEQVPELVEYFDWALVEECFQYDFCDDYIPFIDAGKAVFGVEYSDSGLERDDYCPIANAYGFSWLTKELDLGDSPPNACTDYETHD